MIKTFIILLFIFLGKTVICQQYVYNNPKDSSQNFYILRLPKESIKGLLVLNARNLSDSSNQKAQEWGICILTIVPTARPLENLNSIAVIHKMDQIIGSVIRQYKIPPHNLIIGGMSVAGTGAIRYTEYCYANKSKEGIKPAAVFAVDPPLDYERLYN